MKLRLDEVYPWRRVSIDSVLNAFASRRLELYGLTLDAEVMVERRDVVGDIFVRYQGSLYRIPADMAEAIVVKNPQPVSPVSI